LEKGIGFEEISHAGGVLDESITIQTIKIYAPNNDEKQVVNVISNAYVDDSIKHVTPADIVASISYFFNLLHGVDHTELDDLSTHSPLIIQ